MSPRDKRTAIVGATIVGTLLTVSRGLPASIAWQRRQTAELAEISARLSSVRDRLRSLPRARDTLRVRRLRLAAFDSVLLSGASSSAAAAHLAALVDEMATDARLRITTMQLRQDSATAGSLTVVAVRINGVTDVAGLAAFLRAIETDDAPLVVRGLSVMQSEPSAAENRVEALHVEILVEGLAHVRPERAS